MLRALDSADDVIPVPEERVPVHHRLDFLLTQRGDVIVTIFLFQTRFTERARSVTAREDVVSLSRSVDFVFGDVEDCAEDGY